MGTPDLWDPSTAVFTNHSYYLSSTWSPCGQFVAVVAEEAVEIWDALALKLLSTLQSPGVATRFRPGLAYSPDGRSLAGCYDTAVVIWDTQTGGVVKEIECRVTGDGLELVWSLDGKTIGTISPRVVETLTVHTYDVSSGTTLSPGTFQSREKPYLWAHDKYFRIVTAARDRKDWTIDILGLLLQESNHSLSGSIPLSKPSLQQLIAFPFPSLETEVVTLSFSYGMSATQRSCYRKQAITGTSTSLPMEASSQLSPGTTFLSGYMILATTSDGGNSDRLQPNFNSRRLRHQSWAVPVLSSVYYIWIILLVLLPWNLSLPAAVDHRTPFHLTVPTLHPRAVGKVPSQSPASFLKILPLPSSSTQIWKYRRWSSRARFSW